MMDDSKTRNVIMKTIMVRALYFILFFLFSLIWSCTSNPFGSDNNISNNTVIGNVELNDGLSPKNVFAWFKVFDISARTDEEGHFELTLPPSGSQAAGGLNGIYSLYFYMANYQLDSVQIVITNGNIQASSTGVKNNGELVQTVQLAKLLDIKISFSSSSLVENQVDPIIINFTVEAKIDEVDVTADFSQSSGKGDPQFIVGFARKINSDEEFCMGIFRENRSHGAIDFQISNNPIELLPLEIFYKPDTFTIGEYEVIPSLVIKQNLPIGLLDSLGNKVGETCKNIFNVPLRIKNNRFQVVSG